MKIGIVGDCHKNLDATLWAMKKLKQYDCDVAIQLGDFGFVWPNSKEDALDPKKNPDTRHASLHQLSNQLDNHIPLYFIDGNHDWHPELARMGATHDAGDFVPLTKNITYIPRGFKWEWDGVKFLAVGGAFSVDSNRRQVGRNYWLDETISDDDVERAVAQGPVDVMLTHDAPEIPPALDIHLRTNGWALNAKLQTASRRERLMLAYIGKRAMPKVWYHGHYHHKYVSYWEGAKVYGLGCDGMGHDQLEVFKTEDIKKGRL